MDDGKVGTAVSVGGPPGGVRVSLTLRGRNLDPDEITRKLQCAPDSSHRRGEPRKRGTPYADGLWGMALIGDGETRVDGLIDRLLDRVDPDARWDELSVSCEVTFGLYVLLTSDNQDFVIPRKQLSRLVGMGAELWCDIYSDTST